MKEDEIQLLLELKKLGNLGEAYYAQRLPCIDFKSTASTEADSLTQSHMGGTFLAPLDFSLPVYEGMAMDFVCQINAVDVQHLAPHIDGHLLFFAPVQLLMEGHDAAAVVHVPQGATIISISASPSEYFRQKPALLPAKTACSLPAPMDPFQSPATQPWHEGKRAIKEKIWGFYSRTTRIEDDLYHSNYHRFMGHPDPVQYDARPYIRRICPASEWLSLLAVYEDRNAELYFGETGALYFYIPKEHFEKSDFSRIYACIQTT